MKVRKKVFKAAFAVLLIVSMLVPSSYFMPALNVQASTIDDLNKKLSDLQNQKKAKDDEIKNLQNDITKKQEYIQALQDQAANVQSQIDVSKQKIADLDGQITDAENAIAGKNQEIQDGLNTFKQRLRLVYKMGDFTTLDIVLNAQDINDFIDRAEFTQSFNDHDTALLQKLTTDKNSIAAQKADIEQKRQEVADEKTNLDSKKAELDGYTQKAQTALQELNASKQQTEQESAQIKKQMDAADNAIKAYIAEQEKIRQQQQQQQYSGGGFIRPVKVGYSYFISSEYGPRDGGYHYGRDYAVPVGTPIVASKDGTIVFANSTDSWGSGWGYYVFISHGGGFYTRYAHLSQVVVSPGQTVKQGDIIGYSGGRPGMAGAGSSEGPHCHFEVYVGTERKDPRNYLSN